MPKVTARLVPALHPDKIIVFGSRARGEDRPDSDLDLLVVESGGGTGGQRSVRVRGALDGLGVPLDLVVCTPAEYEKLRHWRSMIVGIADREGRVLYEQHEAA